MSNDDDKFVYSTLGVFPGSESGSIVSFLTTERGPTGWINTPVSPSYSMYEREELIVDLIPVFPGAFSEDLKTAAWLSLATLTSNGQPEKQFGLYRKSVGKAPEFIAKVGPRIGLGLASEYRGFVDIANDGSRVVFTTAEHLLPGDASRASGESVYAWEDGNLRQLDIDDGGNLLSPCGAHVSKENGMSASASLVFFTVRECGGFEREEVYVRDLETETTKQISASECARVDCNAPQSVTFATATRNGSAAFITTKQQLTDEDHDESTDLYRYDVGSGELTLLSGGSEEASGEVLAGRVYPSDNGGRVYFLGEGEVLPGETSSGQKLFLADSSGVHFVAEISYNTKPEIQLSADGSRALFVTKAQLLTSDTDAEPDVYLYDANQESLTQISIGPSGGNAESPADIEAPIERPEFQSTGDYQPFYAIDGSGERLFFSTREQLLPEDQNSVADIYEWWNGQLGLISSGEDAFDSGFGGVSRDGRSVLFVTNATLTRSDVDDGNRDFYVARLEGGFPEAKEEGCDVELCPAPGREQIARPTPQSLLSRSHGKGRLRLIRLRSMIVLAEAPKPGRVSASVWVRMGGRKVVLAAGSADATQPGKVRIALRLTRAGRKAGAGEARAGHLTLKEGTSTVSRAVKLDLR